MLDLSLVVPCCNEEDSIPALVETLFPVIEQLRRERSVEVVFVDDGSRDRTYELLQQITTGRSQMRIERHPVNRGLGAALRTGFASAQGDVIVTTDSDGTYRFEEIPAMLSLLTPGVEIVTASPYHKKGGIANVPTYRIILSRGSSLIYQVLVDRHIATYTALFRAYRHEVVRRVPFKSDGFLAGTELMVSAMLMGYHVAEYPAVLHARAAGASKAKILRIIRAHLNFQWHVLLWRLHLMAPPQPLEPESNV
jgi:dolichol-phosphate mannosyltransferase